MIFVTFVVPGLLWFLSSGVVKRMGAVRLRIGLGVVVTSLVLMSKTPVGRAAGQQPGLATLDLSAEASAKAGGAALATCCRRGLRKPDHIANVARSDAGAT